MIAGALRKPRARNTRVRRSESDLCADGEAGRIATGASVHCALLPIAYANNRAAERALHPEIEEAVRILGGTRLIAIRRAIAAGETLPAR